MALNLFKILTIFGNLQRVVNHFKWLKKACSARLYDTIKTAFIKKSVISCRPTARQLQDICNDDNQNINADFWHKVDSLQLQIPFTQEAKRSNSGQLSI